MKTFLFCSANLTDCFFAAESEEIAFLYCRKFFFTAVIIEEIGFFAAESEESEVSLLQKVKRLFLYCRK